MPRKSTFQKSVDTWRNKSIDASSSETQEEEREPLHLSALCPEDLMLSCSDEWTGISRMNIPHGKLSSIGNSAAVKFCEYSNETAAPDSQLGSDLPSLPPGVLLVKCDNAQIRFGWGGGVTCGVSRGSGGKVHRDVLLATDIIWPVTFQHVVQNGLGMSFMYKFLQNTLPDIDVLTGAPFKDFYIDAFGAERVHILHGRTQTYVDRLYFSTISDSITFLPGGSTPSAIQQVAERFKFTLNDPLLPCSVRSMPAFDSWVSNFTQTSSNGDPKTLLYLQRTHNRVFDVWDCRAEENNSTCSCTRLTESKFIDRLDEFGLRHGLTLEVFNHTTINEDAQAFSRAEVVLGPHGGAFTNMIFMKPDAAVIIEAHNGERQFFGFLAAALGIRHMNYMPQVWRGYDGDNTMSIEINDFLNFVEESMATGSSENYQANNCASLIDTAPLKL